MPEIYPDLFAAATAWFNSDPVLTAAFPGGFHLAKTGVSGLFPYVKLGWRKPQPGLSLEDEQYLITLAVYSFSDDESIDLGELLVKSYLDEARAPLAFTDKRGRSWREAMRKEQEATGPEPVDIVEAVDGGPDGYVYRYRVPIEVWVIPA